MFQPIYHLRFHGGPFDGVAETSTEFVPTNKLQMPATPRLAEMNAACHNCLVEPWCAAYRLVRSVQDLEDGRPAVTLRYEFLAYEMVEMSHERGLPSSLMGCIAALVVRKIAPMAGRLGRWLTAPVEYPLQSSRWTCAAPLPQAASTMNANQESVRRDVGNDAGFSQPKPSEVATPQGVHDALRNGRRLPGKAR